MTTEEAGRRWAGRVCVGVLVVGALAGPARAADPARVEELINEANQHRREGRDNLALPLLRQAYELARTPRTSAQLGLAEAALGYWLEAEQHLAEATTAEVHHPWVDKNRAVLEEWLGKSRSHIGEIQVSGSPSGAEVRVNANPAGRLPLPQGIRVAEGLVTVEASAPGYTPAKRTLRITGGALEHLSIELEPVAPAAAEPAHPPVATAPAATAPAREPPTPATAIATRSEPAAGSGGAGGQALRWSLAAGTAAALGIAVWQHVGWRSSQHDFEAIDACGADVSMRGADARCAPLYDTLAARRRNAGIAYGAAGVLGVVTVILFASGGGSSPAPQTHLGPGPGDVGIAWGVALP